MRLLSVFEEEEEEEEEEESVLPRFPTLFSFAIGEGSKAECSRGLACKWVGVVVVCGSGCKGDALEVEVSVEVKLEEVVEEVE